MNSEVPESVKRLIAEHIGSVSELEAILLLREHRGRAWTLAEAEERLYVHGDELSLLFGRLVARGFFTVREGRYLYAAAPNVDETVQELARCYAQHVVAVTNLIHANAAQRVRALTETARRRSE
jgi:hypothetical protein